VFQVWEVVAFILLQAWPVVGSIADQDWPVVGSIITQPYTIRFPVPIVNKLPTGCITCCVEILTFPTPIFMSFPVTLYVDTIVGVPVSIFNEDPVVVTPNPKDNTGSPVDIVTSLPSTSIKFLAITVAVPTDKLTLDPTASTIVGRATVTWPVAIWTSDPVAVIILSILNPTVPTPISNSCPTTASVTLPPAIIFGFWTKKSNKFVVVPAFAFATITALLIVNVNCSPIKSTVALPENSNVPVAIPNSTDDNTTLAEALITIGSAPPQGYSPQAFNPHPSKTGGFAIFN